MYRDVTELLAVDASDLRCSTAYDAVRVIKSGDRAVVADDATAVLVLTLLGLTQTRAAYQVRSSHGPFLDPSHPRVQHLREMADGSPTPGSTHIEIPTDWARLDTVEKDRVVEAILTHIGKQMHDGDQGHSARASSGT